MYLANSLEQTFIMENQCFDATETRVYPRTQASSRSFVHSRGKNRGVGLNVGEFLHVMSATVDVTKH